MNARQIQRLENKKRKMDALNEIKSLNEADKQLKRPYSLVNVKPVVKKKSKLILYLKHQGESARVNDTGLPQSRIPLFVSDVRDFLLYIVFNKTCPPYTEPRWCNVSKKRIDHTVLLVVEGLSLNEYLRHSQQMPCLRDGFVKMEIVPPSSYSTSLIHELVMSSKHEESQDILPSTKSQSPTGKTSIDSVAPVHTVKSAFPISKCQIKASKNTSVSNTAPTITKSSSGGVETSLAEKESSKNSSNPNDMLSDMETSKMLESRRDSTLSGPELGQSGCLPEGDKFPRTMLLLSALQMIEEDYPIPLRGELSARFSKYINTKDVYSEVTPHSPLFGLDCEMCKTANDRTELTRVTLVDEHENVIYESLVKPYNTITNYLTPYSGITRALLAPVATRLEDAQRALIQRLPSDAILVGQSLNCDLHALKMMHPYVIDTSVIFNTTGVRTHKPKLKTLASHFLGMDIQSHTDGAVGHCSKEDAIAALKLVKLKLSKDPQFGDTVALQKCIRNINSNLACPGEVRNLWAYFDKIQSKKKLGKVEKTALVLTTEKDAETEYRKYLATYRTKCKLLTGHNREPNNSNEKEDLSTTLKEEEEEEEPNNTPIPNHLSNETKSVEIIALNEIILDSNTNCDNMDDESAKKRNSSISQTKSNCKRKLTPSSNNQLSNNDSPRLVDLTELDGPRSPPSKVKKDNRDGTSDKGCLTSSKVTSKHTTHTKTENSALSNNVKELINGDNKFEDKSGQHIDSNDSKSKELKTVENRENDKGHLAISSRDSSEDTVVVTRRTSPSGGQNPTSKSLAHKQLGQEILQVLPQKELVIGHMRLSDVVVLNQMVEKLENGLAENQLLVVLCVPGSEEDRSSGVCFVCASSC